MAGETTTAPPPVDPAGTTAAALGLIDQQYARLNALRGPAPNGGQYTREEQRLYGLAQEDLKRAQEERDRTPRPEAPKTPELRPFGERPPEADPLKAFGSWAVALGILGGALTRTPLTTALNAAGGAMEAIRKNDLDMYEKRRQEWKDATDLAVKNADLQMKAYDVAFQAWREGRSNWASALATANTMAGHLASEHRADMAAAASRADNLFAQKLHLLQFRGALEEKAAEQGSIVRVASQLDGENTSDAQKQANRMTATQLLKDYGQANVDEALTRVKEATPGWEAMNPQQRAAAVNSTLRSMKQEDARAARLKDQSLSLAQRILAEADITGVGPKEADSVVAKMRAAGKIEQLISEAQNLPGAANVFGELPSKMQGLSAWWERNVTDRTGWWKKNVVDETDDNKPGNEAEARLRGELDKLKPTDQAAVFYKEAIFTIIDAEREARGGGVLPVAFFKNLTSLMDPKSNSRDTFIGVMSRRLADILNKTNLSDAQIAEVREALRKQRSRTPAPAAAAGPAPAANPDPAAQAEAREALDWVKKNPGYSKAAEIKRKARATLGLPPE